jgi:hypothetical protein
MATKRQRKRSSEKITNPQATTETTVKLTIASSFERSLDMPGSCRYTIRMSKYRRRGHSDMANGEHLQQKAIIMNTATNKTRIVNNSILVKEYLVPLPHIQQLEIRRRSKVQSKKSKLKYFMKFNIDFNSS